MQKTLNVLSIDFDFFQKVPTDTIVQCFPDGHDFGNELAQIIWTAHYGNPHDWKKLLHIKPATQYIADIRKIIQNNAKQGPYKAMITNSHAHIYNFIQDEKQEHGYDNINIVNIDMHHDMFDENTEITCGNWLYHIIKNNPNTNVTWIANNVSNELFPCPNDNIQIIIEDFNGIQNTHWDLIFLCRSDLWTPPHLDRKFISLAKTIMKTSIQCQYEPTILESRYNDQFIRIIQ